MQDFESFGKASVIPGLQHAIDVLQAELDQLKEALHIAQNGASPPQSGAERKASKQRAYWAAMTPEERRRESLRRLKKRKPRVKLKAEDEEVDINRLHPRDPRSPRHAAFKRKLRKANKANWANMTPEARAERVAKMVAPRRAA